MLADTLRFVIIEQTSMPELGKGLAQVSRIPNNC